MSATPEPRWAEPQSAVWDPFSDNPLAPMSAQKSALEPTRLRLVKVESAAPAPTPVAPAADAAPAAAEPVSREGSAHQAPPAEATAPTDTRIQDEPEAVPATHTAPEAAPETAPEAAAAAPSDSEIRAAAAAQMRERLIAMWTPPRVLTERPASVMEVLAYAESGPQHTRPDGAARNGSKAWALLVAAPITVVAYLLAWVAQRPGRAATVTVGALLVWLAVLTS